MHTININHLWEATTPHRLEEEQQDKDGIKQRKVRENTKIGMINDIDKQERLQEQEHAGTQ